MNIGALGLELIKKFEGCKLTAYRCPAGIPTIGYGHTRGVRMGMTITLAQAESLLKCDLMPVERHIMGYGLKLNQNQFDALCSFSFNLGCAALDRSTLLKKVRIGAPDYEITKEFNKWVLAGGRKLPGLVKRRMAEAELFVLKPNGHEENV